MKNLDEMMTRNNEFLLLTTAADEERLRVKGET